MPLSSDSLVGVLEHPFDIILVITLSDVIRRTVAPTKRVGTGT